MSATQLPTLSVGGAVVVFAKCPLAGTSKTRLAPLLGSAGAARLAQAMLSDVLVSLSDCPSLRDTLKVLYYAPGTRTGASQMVSILKSLHLSYHEIDMYSIEARQPMEKNNVDASGWILLPMKSSAPTANALDLPQTPLPEASTSDLVSSSLGDKLADALEKTRALIGRRKASAMGSTSRNEAVVFLGMDAPELPMEEIVYGLRQGDDRPTTGDTTDHGNGMDGTVHHGTAHLCPAHDGGYGLLAVPKQAPSAIFAAVRWSHSLTAVSQLKALTDYRVPVSLGKLMYDVDEPKDVQHLATRLAHARTDGNKHKRSIREIHAEDSLTRSSSGVRTSDAAASYPHHTWKALTDLNVIH